MHLNGLKLWRKLGGDCKGDCWIVCSKRTGFSCCQQLLNQLLLVVMQPTGGSDWDTDNYKDDETFGFDDPKQQTGTEKEEEEKRRRGKRSLANS